jgi:hypothetical protein
MPLRKGGRRVTATTCPATCAHSYDALGTCELRMQIIWNGHLVGDVQWLMSPEQIKEQISYLETRIGRQRAIIEELETEGYGSELIRRSHALLKQMIVDLDQLLLQLRESHIAQRLTYKNRARNSGISTRSTSLSCRTLAFNAHRILGAADLPAPARSFPASSLWATSRDGLNGCGR